MPRISSSQRKHTMTRQNVQLVLVAVVLIGVAGVAAGQAEELVRVISMEPGGRLTLANRRAGSARRHGC
jgi:hypothetical protein